jgi:PhoH-like ATPase
MRKTFILDTSVLLYDSQAIHSFPGNDIVLPLVVLEELDKFKERQGLVGQNARYVNRFLDEMRSIEVDEEGWRTKEEYDMRYRFELSVEIHECVPEGFDIGYNDNIIIGCALHLASKKDDVYVITKDINLRVKCDAVGLGVEDYLKDRVEENVDNLCGWKQLELGPEQFSEFYESNKVYMTDTELKPNQFVIGKSQSNQSLLGIYKDGAIHKLTKKMDGLISVEPRNAEQSFAIEALLDPNIPLVCLTGLAGSGKTFLALMAALSKLGTGRTPKGRTLGADFPPEMRVGYERLVISRTLQPVGRDLGYLPGSMEEKMQPWLMPILDNVRHAFKDTSYFQMMIEKGDIEIAPIPYIRGRTFANSILIVDEAQNATIHELKTIITRMGTNSKIVLLGDVDQIDTPYIDRQSSGLSIVIDKFQNSSLCAHVNLSKGQRSDLASVASNIL